MRDVDAIAEVLVDRVPFDYYAEALELAEHILEALDDARLTRLRAVP